MKKKNVSPGEEMMRKRLQAHLEETDRERGKGWKNPSGRLFRLAKVLYYVTAVYSFMVYLLNELTFFLLRDSQLQMDAAQQAFYRSNGWLVHGLFALSFAAFLLMLFHKTKTACGVQLGIGVLLVLQIVQVFVGEYGQNKNLLAILYCFIFLSVIAAGVLLWILLASRSRLEKAVEAEYAALYSQLSGADWEQDLTTDQQLQEALLARETALAAQPNEPSPVEE